MKIKIIEIRKEINNCFSIILEKPKGFNFYPGQYLDYELKGDTRAFTISSSPTEDFLMLSTRRGQTPFKKALEKLEPGDFIESSHPAGTFTLDETEPAVFIAGGIGITPFRSMIKYALDQKLATPITLIYSNSDDNFVFKEELEKWKKKLNLTIIYHDTSQNGHLASLPPTTYPLQPIYYLSGSPKFADNTQKILLDMKIDETNIRSDYFDGYE